MKWESSKYVWNIGIAQTADKGPHKMKSPETYFAEAERIWIKETYTNSKPGDILWINCQLLHYFYNEILPELDVPVVLIVCDGDNSFPSDSTTNQEGEKFDSTFDVERLLSNDNIIHVFAQNCDYKGESNKVTAMPIGCDFHSIAYRGGGWREFQMTPAEQCHQLDSILSSLRPASERIPKAFIDFQNSDTMHGGFRRYKHFGYDRQSLFDNLKYKDVVDYGPFMKRSSLWNKKGGYAFSICPTGNGLQTHRLWEDLLLGCIVITIPPVDPVYKNFPVVVVKDVSEITHANMSEWIKTYGPMTVDPSMREQLTCDYWIKKIKALGP